VVSEVKRRLRVAAGSAGKKLAYGIGLTGTAGGPRRFLRFTFVLRCILVGLTPLFFRLHTIKQYGLPEFRWLVWGGLVAWTLLVGLLIWRRTGWIRQASLFEAIDVAVCFGTFVATTRYSSGSGISYSAVVVVGAFQLQTYAPVLTTGALSGVWAGFVAGLAGMFAYPLSLVVVGRSFDGLFGPTQITNTITRSSLYLLVGVIFGGFQALAMQAVTIRSSLEKAEEGELEKAAELRALNLLHQRGVGKFGVVHRNMRSFGAKLDDSVRQEFDGLVNGFAAILADLRHLGFESPGSRTLTHVLHDVAAVHGMEPLVNDDYPVSVEIPPGDTCAIIEFDPQQADHLDAIVAELINNAKKYAREGAVVVHAATEESGIIVEVSDAGPNNEDSLGTGLGRGMIEDYCDRHGWACSGLSVSGRKRERRGAVRLSLPHPGPL
jgi:hypothetical protein